MARKRSLSAREVDSIKASGVHWVAPSLYMQVRPENGTRSWLFRCSIDGKNHWFGLGSCRDVKLSDARDEADQLRIGHRRGVNPLLSRSPAPVQPEDEQTPTAPTFRERAEAYLASHAPTWKNDKHIAGWERSLADHAGPVMGSIPVDQISVDHVMKVVEPIWLSKPETAHRTLSRIEHVIAWAIAAGHRPGDNPATRDAVRYLPPKANPGRFILDEGRRCWSIVRLLDRHVPDAVAHKGRTAGGTGCGPVMMADGGAPRRRRARVARQRLSPGYGGAWASAARPCLNPAIAVSIYNESLALPRNECQSPIPMNCDRSLQQGGHMSFRPLHDRVLIRRLDEEEKTAGGIIIPDTAKEKPSEGEVIAVGPGARDEDGKRVPMDVKAGDRILFGKWSGAEVKIDGEDLLIMKESDIMGVIEKTKSARKAA
jgi:chaperonin GroES